MAGEPDLYGVREDGVVIGLRPAGGRVRFRRGTAGPAPLADVAPDGSVRLIAAGRLTAPTAPGPCGFAVPTGDGRDHPAFGPGGSTCVEGARRVDRFDVAGRRRVLPRAREHLHLTSSDRVSAGSDGLVLLSALITGRPPPGRSPSRPPAASGR